MCKPTHLRESKSGNGNPTKQSKKKSLFTLTNLATLFALLLVALPMMLSEAIGGWTRKYTAPWLFWTPEKMGDLTGNVVIVTGANTGIGYHTALQMALHGATVIVGARSPSKGQAAVDSIKEQVNSTSGDATVQFLPLDLSSLASVQSFAQEFLKLDLPLHTLVLNAGVMKSPGAAFVGQNMTYGFETTQDGFEQHIGVNHIGHFYLTQLLRETLVASAPSRVVSVSSMAEMASYQPEGIRFDMWKADKRPDDYEDGAAYGQSKLANLLFAKELASQLNGTGATAYSCHPGVIQTELARYMTAEAESKLKGWLDAALNKALQSFFNTALFLAPDGALTQLHLATADPSILVNGGFYHPIGKYVETPIHSQASNETLPSLLWTETERMIQSVGF